MGKKTNNQFIFFILEDTHSGFVSSDNIIEGLPSENLRFAKFLEKTVHDDKEYYKICFLQKNGMASPNPNEVPVESFNKIQELGGANFLTPEENTRLTKCLSTLQSGRHSPLAIKAMRNNWEQRTSPTPGSTPGTTPPSSPGRR